MSKIPNGHEIITLFESMYPKHLAMEGDKVGLQIGALNKSVENVLIALDVTEEVVKKVRNKHPFNCPLGSKIAGLGSGEPCTPRPPEPGCWRTSTTRCQRRATIGL